MRLQRALARVGRASRRGAEELIRAGRVRVNGRVAELGARVDPARDVVTVDGKRVGAPAAAWLALHKPEGYIVTRRDERGRPTVFDLVPEIPGLVYVGRLDAMTAGLLLLTTDGAAVHRLTHPRYAVERTYRVTVHGRDPAALRRVLSRPIVIDAQPVRIVRYRVRPRAGGACEIILVLTEGRHRIVRRLCQRMRVTVSRLIRTRYGPIRLGRLARGTWRYLTPAECRGVEAAA